MSDETPLEGFDVRGRNGTLGIVVDPRRLGELVAPEALELYVIGGRSSLLHLHIPMSHVADISTRARTVDVDVDIVDFRARLADDGTIQLHVND